MRAAGETLRAGVEAGGGEAWAELGWVLFAVVVLAWRELAALGRVGVVVELSCSGAEVGRMWGVDLLSCWSLFFFSWFVVFPVLSLGRPGFLSFFFVSVSAAGWLGLLLILILLRM